MLVLVLGRFRLILGDDHRHRAHRARHDEDAILAPGRRERLDVRVRRRLHALVFTTLTRHGVPDRERARTSETPFRFPPIERARRRRWTRRRRGDAEGGRDLGRDARRTRRRGPERRGGFGEVTSHDAREDDALCGCIRRRRFPSVRVYGADGEDAKRNEKMELNESHE